MALLDGTRSCCGCPKTAGVAPCCVSLAAELPQLLPEEWCNMILPRRGGPHADAKPSMAFLLAAGLLVLEKSDRLISKGKAKAPGTLLGWHKRAVPLTLPAAPEAGGDARADARERAARAAVEAAQHTVWTPAREGALLAALAATPEYAAGQRLPDERWLEIAATLAEPGWTPHGLTAVKSYWSKHLLKRQYANLPPPSTPATSRESRPRDWSPAADAPLRMRSSSLPCTVQLASCSTARTGCTWPASSSWAAWLPIPHLTTSPPLPPLPQFACARPTCLGECE
jgi:hypothetical protein